LLNRKSAITVLLIIALFVVVFLSLYNRSQHGDPDKWIKEHGKVANRHADIDRFCIDCHTKKLKQTKENFCNNCHRESNVKLVK